MRILTVCLALALSACAARSTTSLAPADAATALISGDRLTMMRAVSPAGNDDPLVLLTLTHPDGRSMRFEEANHAPTDVMAQAPGGPLSQVMGLFGDERPTLLSARAQENYGAPFLCAPDGPAAIGLYEDAEGIVQIVGLKQAFQFEERPDGSQEAAPYSPDQVCARLRFRKG